MNTKFLALAFLAIIEAEVNAVQLAHPHGEYLAHADHENGLIVDTGADAAAGEVAEAEPLSISLPEPEVTYVRTTIIEGNTRTITTDTTTTIDNGDCTNTVIVSRHIEKFITYGSHEHSLGEIEGIISEDIIPIAGCDGAGTLPVDPLPVDEVGICECTGVNNVAPIWDADGNHYIELEIDGEIQQYPANYGTVCGAWDLDLPPICD